MTARTGHDRELFQRLRESCDRVFVTGATGFIGSAIVQELMSLGHQMLGLACTDAAADALARLGIEAHRGDLSDIDSLAAGARACDGVIHTAFIHDYGDRTAAGETDPRAIEALGAALAGSGRPLIATSGTAHLPAGRIGTEEDAPDLAAPSTHRVASEETTLALASRGSEPWCFACHPLSTAMGIVPLFHA